MFFIYLYMVSHQKVFLFSLSNDFPSCTDLGISTKNLCIRTKYFDFSFTMMRLRFATTFRIHYANIESLTIWICNAYLAICTGYEFLISLRVTLVVLPSFHWTRTSTPFVVSLWSFISVRVMMNTPYSFTSVPSYQWLMISRNRTCRFYSTLT